MTVEELIEAISEKATALTLRGQTPRTVELGHVQANVLKQCGYTSGRLNVPIMLTPGVGFRGEMECFPASETDCKQLAITLVADADRLEVTTAPPEASRFSHTGRQQTIPAASPRAL